MSVLRIQILPADVVNQIAAGEVVERPASVVKELAENALDAGARQIDVAIERGGLSRIRVVDDGSGMSAEEAALALERHATSKLRPAEDLQGVVTMGFRGEALPSIASVSRLTLQTRLPGAPAGSALRVEGGAIRERAPCGCREGTLVEVGDLFFNTPARRKFMKSTATETAHVTEAVHRLALAAPRVHFTLEVDGRRSLELPPCATHLERARAILGRRGEGMIAVARREDPALEIEACLAPPELAGRTAGSVALLANGRFVRERTLLHAVLAGYGDLLETGRYPLAVIHLALDPATIDVNVHPQKTEIRLADPHRVHAALKRCVALGSASLRARSPEPQAARAASEAPRRYGLRAAPAEAGAGGGSGYEEQKRRLVEAGRRFWSAQGGSLLGEALVAYRNAGLDDEAPGPYSSLRVLGQALGSYLICEGEDELVLIDLETAREQVALFELRRAAERGELAAQRLLVPVVVPLEERHAELARAEEASLRALGLELEHFGGASVAVRAIPALLQGADPASLLRDLLDELERVGSGREGPGSSRDELLARMAPHGPLPGGLELDAEEQRALLRRLDRAEDEAGRGGVVIRLERAELERRLRS